MRKFSSIIKENKTILAITLAVAILTGLNLLIPEKNSGNTAEIAPEVTAKPAGLKADADAIVISEFMTKNRAVLRDEDGDFPDWIELLNISDREVSLEGWSISDKDGKDRWRFPKITLPAGERILLYASGKDRPESLHSDFSLSEGEEINLCNKSGYKVFSVKCPESEGDTSFCLKEDRSFEPSLYPTPGRPNDAESYDELQSMAELGGPLIINEVQTANLDPSGMELPENYDWVEVKNVSDESISLSEYFLSDDDDELSKWQFPDVEIMPGEIVTVYCEEKPESGASSKILCTEFSLNSSSEQMYLSKSGEIQDYVSLRDIPYLCSYGRLSGENGWFYMQKPSPGEENNGGFRRVSRTPQVISGDGVSEGAESVKVEIQGNGTVYYTTDGSAPNENSRVYSAPIELKKTGIIRAVSVEEGAMPSRVLDISCIINEGHSLPVMSLVADNPDQFKGMYDGGVKGLELPGSLALYEEDSRFNIPCGIKIHGETSRSLPKKNMSVRFRGAYGQEKLSYDVYGGGVTEFTNFVLRAGQDFYSGIVRNELCQNLALEASDSLVSQRSKYCVLYINGKYSGIYALMEKPNEQHYASLAGVSRDSVTVMESEVPLDSDIYQEVFLLCMQNDMTQKENYDRFCTLMDVDSLIDWILLEGFCGNVDLTYGNLRYCRSTENDGKWRLMFYDLDSTFYNELNCFDVLSSFALTTRQVSNIISPLMKNQEFRSRLLSRASELLDGPLSAENVLKELERLTSEIRPEVERDYERFGMTMEKWEWNVDFIKALFTERNWNDYAAERLCDIFSVSGEEREKYFS